MKDKYSDIHGKTILFEMINKSKTKVATFKCLILATEKYGISVKPLADPKRVAKKWWEINLDKPDNASLEEYHKVTSDKTFCFVGGSSPDNVSEALHQELISKKKLTWLRLYEIISHIGFASCPYGGK